MKAKHEQSDCCGTPVEWCSPSVDYKKFPKNQGKSDHFICAKCGEPCEVVDKAGRKLTEEELWESSKS